MWWCDVIQGICDRAEEHLDGRLLELAQRICEALLDFLGCGGAV